MGSSLESQATRQSEKLNPLETKQSEVARKCNEANKTLAETQSKLATVASSYAKKLEELSNTVKEKVSGDVKEAPVLDERIKKLKEQKASLGVKQDILNAEFEEFEVRVTECLAEKGDLAEDTGDVQEDIQMINDKIASVERKYEETMVNVRDRITKEVTKTGAPGQIVMSLDDAAKIRTLGAMELQARQNYFGKVDAVKSAAHLVKNIKHESVVASSAMSVLSRRNASMQIRKLAKSISPMTERIDEISDITSRVEDEAVRLGRDSHVELSKKHGGTSLRLASDLIQKKCARRNCSKSMIRPP